MKSITTGVLLLTLATAAGCVVGDETYIPGGDPMNPGGGGDGDGDGDGDGGGGGDGTGGGTGGGRISATAFLDGSGKIQCDNAHQCKANFPAEAGGPAFADIFGASATACYGTINQYNEPSAVEAAITANKITFDGRAAKTCLDGMTASACGTFWQEGPTGPAACDTVFVGKVADGAACTVDLECSVAGSYCTEARTCGQEAAN